MYVDANTAARTAKIEEAGCYDHWVEQHLLRLCPGGKLVDDRNGLPRKNAHAEGGKRALLRCEHRGGFWARRVQEEEKRADCYRDDAFPDENVAWPNNVDVNCALLRGTTYARNARSPAGPTGGSQRREGRRMRRRGILR